VNIAAGFALFAVHPAAWDFEAPSALGQCLQSVGLILVSGLAIERILHPASVTA
jgi:hypothetical protein